MTFDQLKPTKIIRGPLFTEPVEVLVSTPMGAALKLIGRGLQTARVVDIILREEKLRLLETTPDTEPFDGDAKMFRLGIEALRLQLAFEYDPYFSLSCARVAPLPHQLEAVYDYFLRLPRIRFLLADDPGAGKTIMAGLLIKELKIRGLVKRILIITPASLSFQWQREMKDKFRENFEVIRSDILRANYGSNPWQDKNQVVTSVSWVSRVEDAKGSLLRSRWEVIEDSFVQAAPTSGIRPKETREDSKIYRVGRVPRQLWPIGERLEARFGKLGGEYKNIVFDKELLPKDPTLEWVTPGHPLFEAVREDLLDNAAPGLQRGSVLYDLNARSPYRLDFFAASVKDGRGNQIHRRLFAVQADQCPSPAAAGEGGRRPGEGLGGWHLSVKQPTVLLDLAVAPQSAKAPADGGMPVRADAERFLIQGTLNSMLAEVTAQRTRETQIITRHLEISLNELINRQQVRLAELIEMQQRGDTSQPLAANLKQTEDRIDELNGRLDQRRAELERERECMIGDIEQVGRAWVLPHPDRQSPAIAAMVSDPEIEKIAVRFAIKHEESEGRVVESVEADNRGFDLISRKPHPEDPKTAIDVRFIEVKGRVETGEIALTSNEYNTAQRLRNDYWLYVVFHCAPACREAGREPSLNILRDPSTLDWQAVTKIEHYRLRQDSMKHPVELREEPPDYRTS